ncbi:hypothetical protein HMPREF9349_00928 [Escherichia coli MS 79-10]|nr:hypothetical protein HMPREF9345_04156 [Escherichia coli MS 107-1]EGU98955.1 hypothetical protein HMPREF9349_00928 [Escherichia coli MS 79-10]
MTGGRTTLTIDKKTPHSVITSFIKNILIDVENINVNRMFNYLPFRIAMSVHHVF